MTALSGFSFHFDDVKRQTVKVELSKIRLSGASFSLRKCFVDRSCELQRGVAGERTSAQDSCVCNTR